MNNDDKEPCPGCEDISEPHHCGWVNEGCPNGCTTDHPTDPNSRGVFICTEHDETFRWCEGCCEVVADSDDFERIFNDWYCNPWDHGFSRCCNCEEWVYDDDVYYSEWDGEAYCDRCYDDGSRTPGQGIYRCHRCGTPNVHMHAITEEFLCDCEAASAHCAGEPVEWENDQPGLKVLANLRVLGLAAA